MKELVSLLASYQPLYAEIVRGYPESRIVELEQVLGRSLPGLYRDFLATAAVNPGFLLDANYSFDIEDVIALAEFKRDGMPAHIYPIALNNVLGTEDYYLDVSKAPSEGDGMVVGVVDGDMAFDSIRPAYLSFRDMLFIKGFRQVRMSMLPYRESVEWPSDHDERRSASGRHDLHAILTRLGLRKLAVTSDSKSLYERGDCAVMVFGNSTFIAQIAADSAASAALVAESLCHETKGHAVRQPW